MAQFSFINSSGGILVPATPDALEYLAKTKLGTVISGEFKKSRNGVMHRRFFALLNLGFEYWVPAGGAISPAEIELIRGYNNFLSMFTPGSDALDAAGDEYLKEVANKRTIKSDAGIVKSFDAFRRWVTIKAGYFTEILLPDNSKTQEPLSISFAKMDDLEFNELYKSAFNIMWQFILSRHFTSQHEAEQTALRLLNYSMQGGA